MSADGYLPPGVTDADACRADWGAICTCCGQRFMPKDDETKCQECEEDTE